MAIVFFYDGTVLLIGNSEGTNSVLGFTTTKTVETVFKLSMSFILFISTYYSFKKKPDHTAG